MTSPPHEDLESVEPAPVAADPPTHPTTPRRRSAVALLAGALVVGLISGVGGAAAYARLYGDRTAKVGSAHGQTALDSVDAVAEKVLPSVVKIYAIEPTATYLLGSGSILTAGGQILTNNHVVESADTSDAILTVRFADGSTASASVVGRDPQTDLAVISVSKVPHLTPIQIGDSRHVSVGQAAVAVGAPHGLASTVTTGIVSAVHRGLVVSPELHPHTDVVHDTIQTDAAINPGSSGGALVDMTGRLIGVTSFQQLVASGKRTGSARNSINIGMNFVIPIDEAMPIVDQLRRGEHATHARLGVDGQEDYASRGVTDGVLLLDVDSGSAAERGGLQVGDVVTALAGRPISTVTDLRAAVDSLRPGASTTLTFRRYGDAKTVSVTLGSDATVASSVLASTL